MCFDDGTICLVFETLVLYWSDDEHLPIAHSLPRSTSAVEISDDETHLIFSILDGVVLKWPQNSGVEPGSEMKSDDSGCYVSKVSCAGKDFTSLHSTDFC
jgi:hypothetical protein